MSKDEAGPSTYPLGDLPHAPSRSLTRRITAPFAKEHALPQEEWKSRCISIIWGFMKPTNDSDVYWRNRNTNLQAYFDSYERFLPKEEALVRLQDAAEQQPVVKILHEAPRERLSIVKELAPETILEEALLEKGANEKLLSKETAENATAKKKSDNEDDENKVISAFTTDSDRLLRYVKLLQLNPNMERAELKNEIIGKTYKFGNKTAGKRLQKAATSSSSQNKPGDSSSSGKGADGDAAEPAETFILPSGCGREDFLSNSATEDENINLFNSYLAAAGRAMFGISIHSAPEFRQGERQVRQTSCLWREDLSLTALLKKEFPTADEFDRLPGRLRERLLSLQNLTHHADITVVWTKHLPDHLMLTYEEQSKTLRIFDLPSLIEVSYEACLGDQYSSSAEKDSCHGTIDGNFAYSSEFMLETLLTYRLLIPFRDIRWAAKSFLPESDHIWSRFRIPGAKKHQRIKDNRLTADFKLGPEDAFAYSPLTTYSQLFKRYPHWGLRLQSLLEEAEDPMPMSWTGRWAERRKGPRHSFWVTVVGFVVATVFAIVATGLAVGSFWVAWCDWQKDGGPPLCNPLGATGPETGISTADPSATP